MAARGLGLAYVAEPRVTRELRDGELEVVLEKYAPTVPGFHIYFPSRSQRSAALRHFVDVAKEVLQSA
jgi:DNA-binding transcriptional LysR family regulator